MTFPGAGLQTGWIKMDKRKAKQAIIGAYLSWGTSSLKLGLDYGYGHATILRWVMAHI